MKMSEISSFITWSIQSDTQR